MQALYISVSLSESTQSTVKRCDQTDEGEAGSVVNCYSRKHVLPNAIADDHQATASYHSTARAVKQYYLRS